MINCYWDEWGKDCQSFEWNEELVEGRKQLDKIDLKYFLHLSGKKLQRGDRDRKHSENTQKCLWKPYCSRQY
jgi:hypothetical protein